MRQAFFKGLAELARKDPRIVLMTGDLGYLAIEPFADAFPERFFNCGVAEQNMVGMATGMAEAGFLPFVYSIVTFATLRPYEFIRNGPVMHRFPVRIVGVGGGVEYGHNGPTHLGLEDVGVMRLLPGLEIYCPADSGQTSTVLAKTWDRPAPIYYRLGKDEKTLVPGLEGRFEIGQAQVLSEGVDVLIVSLGAAAVEGAKARNALQDKGISAAHWIASSIAPAPLDQLKTAKYRLICTIEAHRSSGGLGSLVCESTCGVPVLRCGIDGFMNGRSGSQTFLQQANGVSGEAVARRVLDALSKRSN
jgi:transketolase